MDFVWFLALICAALTAVTSALLFFVDAAKLFASYRASDAPRKLAYFLRITPCYDGLVQKFKCHSVAADGELRGQIAAEAPFLAETGLLEESAVALLLDSLTGFALWAAGYEGFVTAELTFKVHRTVRKGDELFVRAWLKQRPTIPEDKRLRESSVLGFELFAPQPDQESFAEEALVASGEQLMLSIASRTQRFFWKLQLLCPPFLDWKWKMGMKVLDSFNKYSKPFSEIRSIDELLDLKTKELGLYETSMAPRLLNVMGVGHGAATAALLCAAAKRWQKDAKVQKASITYITPVPGMQPVSVSVKPMASSTDEVQVFLRGGQHSAVLARGKVVLQVPRKPAPGMGRLGGLIRPMMSPIPGALLSTLPMEGVPQPPQPAEGDEEKVSDDDLSDLNSEFCPDTEDNVNSDISDEEQKKREDAARDDDEERQKLASEGEESEKSDEEPSKVEDASP